MKTFHVSSHALAATAVAMASTFADGSIISRNGGAGSWDNCSNWTPNTLDGGGAVGGEDVGPGPGLMRRRRH
jgi:hypothetical protein